MDSVEAAALVAGRIAGHPLAGLNGAQGSGKSTLANGVAERAEGVLVLSLDDFYLTRTERERLAREVHPLCKTRGVPGTHDVALLDATLAALADSGQTALPRFDKLADDRLPQAEWPRHSRRPATVLLEGWCVGLRAVDVPAWQGPLNDLEAELDPRGEWFAWSHAALARDYDPLWQRLGLLVSIEVPDWQTVIDSRLRQEQGLAAAAGRRGMDRAEVTRFAEHYERYTRALWAAMPARADLLLRRDAEFGYTQV